MPKLLIVTCTTTFSCSKRAKVNSLTRCVEAGAEVYDDHGPVRVVCRKRVKGRRSRGRSSVPQGGVNLVLWGAKRRVGEAHLGLRAERETGGCSEQ